jgi:hypothetical protein
MRRKKHTGLRRLILIKASPFWRYGRISCRRSETFGFEEEAKMRFYTHHHKYYCGIDLHTSMMYVCITDA